MQTIRPLLLLISAISFGLGISLPLIHFQKFFFFSDTPSLLMMVGGLWQEGEIGLTLVVGLFSIVLPICKQAATYQAVFTRRKLSKWAGVIAKWSMLDVLMVALLVFAAKSSGLATVTAQPGIWFFALSTVTIAIATSGLSDQK
ncbi:MAG: paraquat-inducible protein A [Rhizobiaceae bacterium]